MFRKALLAAALISLPAFAADFGGRYLGLVAGSSDGTDTFRSDETEVIQELDVSGTTYSLIFGYNAQHDDIVIGTEFEIQIAGAEGSILEADPANTFGYDMKSEMGDAYRLRVRFGFPMNDFMPYFATGITSATTTITDNCTFCTAPFAADVNRIGFSVGVGVDWQMGDTWVFRAEYLTEDFGDVVFNDYDNVGDTWDMNLSIDTLRIGASWKF